MEKRDNREALDAAALAGDILLASGAEIFRVEETMARIAKAYGVTSSDTFVLSSGIFLTAGSEQEKDFARVRHIPLCAAGGQSAFQRNRSRKTYARGGQGQAAGNTENAA